jgi:hypothetical protein
MQNTPQDEHRPFAYAGRLVTLYRTGFDFSTVTIPNQSAIEAETGEPLHLVKAVELLREATSDFTVHDPAAERAVALFNELLQLHEEAAAAQQQPAPPANKRQELEEAKELMEMLLDDLSDPAKRAEVLDSLDLIGMLMEDLPA